MPKDNSRQMTVVGVIKLGLISRAEVDVEKYQN